MLVDRSPALWQILWSCLRICQVNNALVCKLLRRQPFMRKRSRSFILKGYLGVVNQRLTSPNAFCADTRKFSRYSGGCSTISAMKSGRDNETIEYLEVTKIFSLENMVWGNNIDPILIIWSSLPFRGSLCPPLPCAFDAKLGQKFRCQINYASITWN